MTAVSTKTNTPRRQAPSTQGFATDDERWQALVDRNPAADGAFFYAVKTTGVFCRPTCPARLPRRENVRFYATTRQAAAAGFRPCLRCRPTASSATQRQAAIVARACRTIESADRPPTLDELARDAGLSRFHFQRVFKAQTGVTPKAYAAAQRGRRVQSQLRTAASITQAIHASGFGSSSRFYETSTRALGMKPQAFRAGGTNTEIRFAVGECWLGSILVAATGQGVCAILLGDDPAALARDLQDRFPRAELIGGDASFEKLVALVVGFVEQPQIGLDLPLDIRGTAFQRRVWEALRQIPAGTTASYAEIAARLGRPKAVRAVASACAANALAVAIPCHRVVRTDGSLSGYRWGVERKRKLQARERGE